MTTANINEPATGKDAGGMAATEQETPKQVAPEQALGGTLSKVPETSQSMPKQARLPRARHKVACLTPQQGERQQWQRRPPG
jgi:hypothetical protein